MQVDAQFGHSFVDLEFTAELSAEVVAEVLWSCDTLASFFR
jgi:hypothetical protein